MPLSVLHHAFPVPRDAKVAVVEWDDQLHCLRNGSLHSFEGDASLREGCPCGTGMTLNSSNSNSNSSYLGVPPIVAADPNGRCAAALVYGRHLALLPAIQADVLEMLLQVCGGLPQELVVFIAVTAVQWRVVHAVASHGVSACTRRVVALFVPQPLAASMVLMAMVVDLLCGEPATVAACRIVLQLRAAPQLPLLATAT
jgi:hypothetical protein